MMTGTEPQFEHEKYEELCALATAGVLTPAESVALFTHLNECAECSQMFAEYQNLATDGMNFLHREFAVPKAAAAFDEDKALARLIEATEAPKLRLVASASPKRKRLRWSRVLTQGLIAASILCIVGGTSYWIGIRSKSLPAASTNAHPGPVPVQTPEQKLSLENTIRADNERIAALEHQADGGRSEVERLRADAQAAADKLAAATATLTSAQAQSGAQIAELTQERDASGAELRDAQAKYQTVQDELNTLRSQHQRDLLQMASFEGRIDSLSASLKDTNTRANDDEQFLSSDRDIRDLIGARNLYIADIMDVNEDGQSRKPFGRVFYTKTKSLIFYAYDLDRQPGIRRASTFTVWGRTGSSDRKPVNLGVLYMDSETNRRWTLRVDNPQQLSQLDAVFVTVEPQPQAERPTGKPFLFASLRREPNHP
jgi:predicted  nucleic acid-binding Zn-ribbon protein